MAKVETKIEQKKSWLSGKKTYIVAFVTIVGAWSSFYLGQIDLQTALEATITAVTAATIRHGIG